MAAFVFPSQLELTRIAQEKTPVLIQDDPAFDILPMRDTDSSILAWEQMDNYLGLQQVRGIDGAPPRVKKVGARRFLSEPGVYGEFIQLDELEITSARGIGSFGDSADLGDIVDQKQDQLLNRRVDRIRQIIWTLLSTGTFSVSGPANNVLHTDTYTTQTSTPGVAWATVATATPLADLRAVKILGRGKGVSFGAGARAYMNQTTANALFANTNTADLGGRYTVMANNLRSVETMNRIFVGEDLPQVVPYDGGYLDDAGAFQLFIPNNKAIVVGQRPAGQSVGEFRFTKNANNPANAAGPYMKVIDRSENYVPATIEVHDGFNGGPVLYFPSAIVLMTV